MLPPRSETTKPLTNPRPSRRAQVAVLGCRIRPASTWPDHLVDQVASLLAAALVKDLGEHPIGGLPVSPLSS